MSLIRPLSAPIDKTHPPGYRAGYRENNKYNPKDIKKWAACIDIDGGALRPFIRGNQKFYTIPHNDQPCFALSIAWDEGSTRTEVNSPKFQTETLPAAVRRNGFGRPARLRSVFIDLSTFSAARPRRHGQINSEFYLNLTARTVEPSAIVAESAEHPNPLR
jgi:hypothetical protein